jgi:hypothetical protein
MICQAISEETFILATSERTWLHAHEDPITVHFASQTVAATALRADLPLQTTLRPLPTASRDPLTAQR